MLRLINATSVFLSIYIFIFNTNMNMNQLKVLSDIARYFLVFIRLPASLQEFRPRLKTRIFVNDGGQPDQRLLERRGRSDPEEICLRLLRRIKGGDAS